MKWANWTTKGSLRPSDSRSCSRCACVVSWPTMLLIGSPTKSKSAKAMKATVNITAVDCSKRRMMKAIMRVPEAVAQIARLFHLNIAQRKVVVRELHEIDVVARRPHHGLLVQRNVSELLLM